LRAEEEVTRVKALVDAGALPPVRLQDAQDQLADAKDNEALRIGLSSNLRLEDVSEQQSSAWIAAAQRRVDRAKTQLVKAEKLVSSGVLAPTALETYRSEVARRQDVVNLVTGQAKVIVAIAEMARAEEAALAAADNHPELPTGRVERFTGKGTFTDSQLRQVTLAYEKEFGRPMPISAKGDTATHRSMGYDHRGRVDIALLPDAPEGEWLRRYLSSNKIPYIAFRNAIAGSATGAHIHIGPPSPRLAVAD
jgi:hypothetical protein